MLSSVRGAFCVQKIFLKEAWFAFVNEKVHSMACLIAMGGLAQARGTGGCSPHTVVAENPQAIGDPACLRHFHQTGTSTLRGVFF